MLDTLIKAASRREQAYPLHTRPEEEPAPPPFSVPAIVEKHGSDYIQDAIRLTWQELQELYHIVKDSLEQHGAGQRPKLEHIDAESGQSCFTNHNPLSQKIDVFR
jgi:hypothetical protein